MITYASCKIIVIALNRENKKRNVVPVSPVACANWINRKTLTITTAIANMITLTYLFLLTKWKDSIPYFKRFVTDHIKQLEIRNYCTVISWLYFVPSFKVISSICLPALREEFFNDRLKIY